MPEDTSKSRVLPKVLVAAGFLAVLACGAFAYWFFFMRGVVYSDDARFGGHLVDLAPEVSGRLLAVGFHEGNRVVEGQMAFVLDSSLQRAIVAEDQAALDTKQGDLAAAQAALAKALAGPRIEEIQAAEATAAQRESDEALAKTELDRVRRLAENNVAAQDQLDRAQSAYRGAQQAHAKALADLALLKAGTRVEDIDAAKAAVATAQGDVEEARAILDHARLDLARTTVAIPFDGWVARRWLDEGSMVQAGQAGPHPPRPHHAQSRREHRGEVPAQRPGRRQGRYQRRRLPEPPAQGPRDADPARGQHSVQPHPRRRASAARSSR